MKAWSRSRRVAWEASGGRDVDFDFSREVLAEANANTHLTVAHTNKSQNKHPHALERASTRHWPILRHFHAGRTARGPFQLSSCSRDFAPGCSSKLPIGRSYHETHAASAAAHGPSLVADLRHTSRPVRSTFAIWSCLCVLRITLRCMMVQRFQSASTNSAVIVTHSSCIRPAAQSTACECRGVAGTVKT